MDFEVTAIRKRPVNLEEMVGQEFVVATLRNAVKTGHIAHAYLFSGPRGVGKTSAARILARSLNCSQNQEALPCGTCGPCLDISRGASPDVIEIDGASNTSVNDVRQIRDEILYAPQGASKKIYIIDEVHMLSNSAFNALLKTIEEPPPYVVFVFATTEVHKVPATIRSRCQQFRFRLISTEVIREKVIQAAADLKKTIDAAASLWIARESTGSLRDAYTLLDQVASFSGEAITMEGIREKMGLVGTDRITLLALAAAEGNRAKALESLDEILASGVAAEQILVELANYFRTLMLLVFGIEKESLLGASLDSFPPVLRESWDVSRIEIIFGEILDLYRDIRYSLDSRYELELLIGRLCALKERLEASDVLKKIADLRRELVTGSWGSANRENPLAGEKKKTPELAEEKAENFFRKFRPGTSNTEKKVPAPGTPPPVEIPRESPVAAVPAPPAPAAPPVAAAPEPPASAAPPVSFSPAPAEAPPPPEQVKQSLSPDVFKARLLGFLQQENLTLGSALEKAAKWIWGDGTLTLHFSSSYEAVVVNKEVDYIRDFAIRENFGPLRLIIKTEEAGPEPQAEKVSPRIDLIKQVFRGQIVGQT